MEEPRIGVYVCWCGTNIAKMVDVEAVADDIKDMENVVVAKNYKYRYWICVSGSHIQSWLMIEFSDGSSCTGQLLRA